MTQPIKQITYAKTSMGPLLDEEVEKRFDDEFLNDFGGIHGITIKQFLAIELAYAKEEAKIIHQQNQKIIDEETKQDVLLLLKLFCEDE